MSGDENLLEVTGLQVHFPIKQGIVFDRTVGHVRAVDGVDLTVARGQTYGLVGESGCGKSTLGRALLRLEEPTAGSVIFDGVDVRALKPEALRQLRRRMQMVFQDPLSSLNPRQSVESLLVEPLTVHGLSSQDAEEYGRDSAKAHLAKAAAMLEVVGLPRSALSRYPHEFSGGQRQRIGIARAMVLNPDLVIADEPVSALDVSVQAQVINLLEDLQELLGLTYLVIAHDLAVVRHISDTVGVMYLGRLVEEAPSDDLYERPLHPYTIALMSAIPIPDPEVEDQRERILLRGDLPSPANPPSGCRFHTRCPYRQPTRCDTEVPGAAGDPHAGGGPSGRLPLGRGDRGRNGRRGRPRPGGGTGPVSTEVLVARAALDTPVGRIVVIAEADSVRRVFWSAADGPGAGSRVRQRPGASRWPAHRVLRRHPPRLRHPGRPGLARAGHPSGAARPAGDPVRSRGHLRGAGHTERDGSAGPRHRLGDGGEPGPHPDRLSSGAGRRRSRRLLRWTARAGAGDEALAARARGDPAAEVVVTAHFLRDG